MIFCGTCHKSKSLQKIHAYHWEYRTWTLLFCPNKNFQENQNITIAMLNLLGNTLIQSPCPKYGSGRNRCIESGLAIDASPVQINTAWLRWLIDGRANQFAKKTNGFCWFRNSKSWLGSKAQVTFRVMPQIKRQGAIRYRFKRIKECWTRSVSWAIDKAWMKSQRKGVLRCFTMKPRPQKMIIEMSPSFMGKAMKNECLCLVYD